MARVIEATAQEGVLIRGSIIEETSSYYWVVDESGNRMAMTWRKDHADKLCEALDVLEDIEGQEGR